jgi:hypothetical protein
MRRTPFAVPTLALLLAIAVACVAQPAQAQRITSGPVPPPGIDRGFRADNRSHVMIPNVPAYIWHHGCGPTALGMIIGYWDGQGFPDLVPGSAGTQTPEVNAMITDDHGTPNCSLPNGDHYQDYCCPIDTYGPIQPDLSELGGAHMSYCVGDFMRTSWSAADNRYGWSWSVDTVPAFLQYVGTQTTYGASGLGTPFYAFTWQHYKDEIDAGRPMGLLVDTDGDGTTDHFITGMGYDDATGEYGCRDTWDTGVHWFAWRQMTSGAPWGIHSVYTFRVGEVFYVNPEGTGDYPTIQAAINAAGQYTTVMLGDGTYHGAGNRDLDFLGKPITVWSEDGNPELCIIDCEGSQAAPHRGFNFHSGESSDATLTGVTITNGYATAGGGGVLCSNASAPTVTNCIFLGNVASAGGGLGAESASPSLTQCTFRGNTTDGYGGAAACGHSAAVFINCTMIENSATEGGGIYCGAGAAVEVANTIMAFNDGGMAVFCNGGGGCTLECTDIYGNAGGDWVGVIASQYGLEGNICADPLFCGLPVNDLKLRAESPCAPHSPQNPNCDLAGAWPVGCTEYACCTGETCAILSHAECQGGGGEWEAGIASCDPNPCLLRACCVEEECQVLNLGDCQTTGGEWQLDIASCDPNPCLPYSDLSGGALIVHYAAGMQWSVEPPAEGWCQNYINNYAITQSEDQVARIDYVPDHISTWFVLAAWDQPKRFCGVAFGLGEYDVNAYAIYEYDVCFVGGGLELPSAGWPGPNEGIAFISEGDPWFGNFVPVCRFAGYAYNETTVIPLGVNQTVTTPFGGFQNCETIQTDYAATCFGAMGINTDGLECHPGGVVKVCCVGVQCHLLTQNGCADLGGVWHEEWGVCDPNPCDVSAVPDRPVAQGTILFAPQPNPFSRTTTLRYHVGRAGPVEITVFDAAGRAVRSLRAGPAVQGFGVVEWDGCDNLGRPAGTGSYFCRLVAGGDVVTQRVLVVE